ncbi:unnamed protein product [Schistocephalus solidus]|uniref:ICA69 domain-containing protein n=1 Tax=Schistocephalus solidus TaxID=70667 RepID=A0A183TT24_SCHSO|nr:unnamed protein product [Schistocephalus solidus]
MKWRNFHQQKPLDGAELQSPSQRTTEEAPGSQDDNGSSPANNGSPAILSPAIPSGCDQLKRDVEGENSDSTPGGVLERQHTSAKVDSSAPETNELLSTWIRDSSSGPDLNNFHLSNEQLCARALWS